jgi:hypothetical protein
MTSLRLAGRSAWISQSLKEDNERPKDNGKAAEQRADGVCRSHGLSNQKEQEKAHGQKDDDPLDPHVALLVFRSFTPDYSNAVQHVQAEASMLFLL